MDKRVSLRLDSGRRLYYDNEVIGKLSEELESFLQNKAVLNTRAFAGRVMYAQEIKSNNLIEGYPDSLDFIEQTIEDRKNINVSDEKVRRVLNLYDGYKYASNHLINSKEELEILYNILSDGLLIPYDIEHRTGYYREKEVFIYISSRLDRDPIECMDATIVEEYMNYFFEYVNNKLDAGSNITDHYIKAAIMHFYFVYIHPYFDVNGRTSRTVSMSYLLENKAYPYIIFNRGINFNKGVYYKVIQSSKISANLTPFIAYMLNQVKTELKKEYIIIRAEESIGRLTPLERQAFNYVLSMKTKLNFLAFSTFYNYYNDKSKANAISEKMINPLFEKGFLVNKQPTKRENGNFFFDVSPVCNDFSQEGIQFTKK